VSDDRKLAVARRRNEHRRNGAAFLAKLSHQTGLDVELIEPAESIDIVSEIYDHVRSLRDASIHRHLTLSDAAALCTEALSALGAEKVDVVLGMWENFPFRCSAASLAPALGALMQFDGDNVTAVTADRRAGAVLDRETESDLPRFEAVTWNAG
jgi:hypothetical protein